MNTKNNQRYHSSDIRMKSAMLKLMARTPFEKITVKEICANAGVNRGTFYCHYRDIYQMLEEIEEHLSNELIEISSNWNICPEEVTADFFIPYIRFMKDHQYFYRIALSNRKSLPIKKSFRPLWERIVRLCGRKALAGEEDLVYFFIYFQAGVTMVLQQWLETGCEKSEEEMAAILAQCVPRGLFEGLKAGGA